MDDTRDQAIAQQQQVNDEKAAQRKLKKADKAENTAENDEEINSDSDSEFHESLTMVDFEKEDGTDASDAQTKTSTLKLPWNKDAIFWFSQFEAHLENAGVKSQWLKRITLHKQLSTEQQDDCMDILKKKKSEAGTQPYYDLKNACLISMAQKLKTHTIKHVASY